MNMWQSNNRYALDGSMTLIEGNSGLPFILVSNSRATALISLYGGQVLSFWPVAEERDLLFLSNKACYDGNRAIRGGIPVCWPWFGPDPDGLKRPNHGFARNSHWQIVDTDISSDHESKLTLRLIQTEHSRKNWPHSCKLSQTITVGNSLTQELITHNTGYETIAITQALHAYFLIGDIEQVTLAGLENHQYLDKLDGGKVKQQTAPVVISEEVDRIYPGVKNQLLIDDPVLKRWIQITSFGSKTAVVWNPWAEASATMSDLEAGDYKRFLCVEAGTTGPNIMNMDPGSEHHLITNYRILKQV